MKDMRDDEGFYNAVMIAEAIVVLFLMALMCVVTFT
jgi:hypothetical protein